MDLKFLDMAARKNSVSLVQTGRRKIHSVIIHLNNHISTDLLLGKIKKMEFMLKKLVTLFSKISGFVTISDQEFKFIKLI